MSVNSNPGNYTRLRKKRPKVVTISARKERNLSIKKVSVILQKDESKRTKEENEMLFNYSEIVNEATLRIEKRRQLKERLKEIEDSEAVLDAKCKQLAEAILKSEYLVAYTGAGISTAARIPDYRGAAGIWTLLQQGKDIGTHDLTQADPTFTHMALFQLYSQGKLKHIVSQNCDGLHLRSGLPKRALSEVHGNMYIEVCRSCRPIIEYLRLFDVTENTARYSHKTMRKCYKCNSSLVDSIVHFGERGNLPWPLNWKGACKAAEKADMILCIGSSLKVLKRYPWLWCMDKPAKRRPHIYIVNLQWTPKDCHARIKINGKCDIVMEKLMKYLSISVPKYSRKSDPIFEHATDLCKEERHTTNKPFLIITKPEIFETKAIKSEYRTLDSDCNNEEIKKEIKIEVPDFDDENFKESQSPCVTSCKKEIVIDTGQGEDVKCVKKELIVITIRSGSDFKDCCNLFKVNQNHECDCPNFVDEQNDIPVIIQDDLLIFKNGSELPVKDENLVVSSVMGEMTQNAVSTSDRTLTKMGEATTSNLSDSNIAQNSLKKENISDPSGSKRSNESEITDNHSKRQKVNDCNNGNSEYKNSTVLSTKSNVKTNNGISVKTGTKLKELDPLKDNYKCSFCSEQYLSSSCLFYVKREPVFKDKVSICDCCSSEEEDEGTDTADDKINDLQKVVTNPGWYGKGIRKNIRKKR